MALSFTAPTAPTIRDNILRTMKNALIARGVPNPNVNKGSDAYIIAQAVANELEVVSLNTVVALDQVMPDTATADDLARIMAIYGLAPRPAGPSTGKVIFSTTSATLVSTGATLLDPNGNPFTVTTGGTYSNGASIPVQSLGVGSQTNLAGGTTLKWVSPPVYSAPTAVFDSNGASGGVDKESDDTARARLLLFLQSYPSGGNAAYVGALGAQADPSIQIVFVYPATNGPGTEHAAAVGYATASFSRSRTCSSGAIANAASAITAGLPEYVESVITGTVDQPADVSFQLQLPASVLAIPAGTGGGWIDANPWPSVAGINASRIYCTTTAVTNSTSMTVESMVAPVVGQSICWVDRNYYALHTAKILTQSTTTSPAGGTPGTYAITIDTPFVDAGNNTIPTGEYIFPAAAQTQNYVNAILSAFANLGPYEKSLAPGLLPRQYRQPRPFLSWSYTLDAKFTQAIGNAGPEVQSVVWGYQNGTVVTPTLPATVSTGPSIFKPSRIGIYSQ